MHSGFHLVGEHTVMPLSYRAEPMPNRLPHRMRRLAERTAPEPPPDQVGIDHSAVTIELDDDLGEVFRIARTPEGEFLERVAGEEQHHSSWLFGDPITPILRCYKGDPARIRLVHGGVKETHVFHLHVHQWRATPQDGARPGTAAGSQLLDSITIGPQTGLHDRPALRLGQPPARCPATSSGTATSIRTSTTGCGGCGAASTGPSTARSPTPTARPAAGWRRSRAATPSRSTRNHPGFPWFIDGVLPAEVAAAARAAAGAQVRPPCPAGDAAALDAREGGVRPRVSSTTHGPGCCSSTSTATRSRGTQKVGLPPPPDHPLRRRGRLRPASSTTSNGWHDDNGHYYRLTGIAISQLDGTGEVSPRTGRGDPRSTGPKPFFPRANQGDIVELTFINSLGTFPADDFDLITPPVECGLHVHLVKFDVTGRRRLVDRLELPVGRELPGGGRPGPGQATRSRASSGSTAGSSTRSSAPASSTTTCWPTSGRSTGCSPR